MARSRASAKRPRRDRGLPSRAALSDFLRESPTPVGVPEAARAFGLAPADRPALRAMLREVERAAADRGAADIPEVAVVERFDSDPDGVPLARLVAWPGPAPAPVVRLDEVGDAETLPIGSRAVARLVRRESGAIEGRILRRLDRVGERVVGVFRLDRDGGGRVTSADRRTRAEHRVAARDMGGAADGELVVGEQLSTPRLAASRVRIVERLGPASAPGAISRLAIAAYGIPTEFPAEALAEAEAPPPIEAERRADLRHLPLVTIDGRDARDFDDAVWAEPDPDPQNSGGWHLVVAIADVAWHVRPGGALDREAERRGNSVYFPDRVVPMLPEALSNELCSLQPGVDRACLAVHLWIDAAGRKRRHRFVRGLMRSAARLTYESVQAAHNEGGGPAAATAPLYGAYAALARARAARGAIELDLAENRVVLDAEQRPAAVVQVERLDSHRLIEEFMILANVAAAEELEARRRPCMYRIHDAPDPEKVAELADFLDRLGISGLTLSKGQAPKPALFNRLLRRAAATPEAALVNELVLRCQAQAAYSPSNIGHFGLALRRYAHFTSPIRRYADLIVHRALLGEVPDREWMARVAEHISATERRAAAAERAAVERYRATLLERSIGSMFSARVSGVAAFGLFVTTAADGAVGLVPVSSLPGDYWLYDERAHRLVGRRSGRVFRLGDEVPVRLIEADAIAGRLVFRLDEGGFAGGSRRSPYRARGGRG
jgi:ribonuclease R